ncbi:MAG: histidinol dehydrogenase, partial [Bacteroidales bacterium]|nr:histidinol dehydrogenase [Bacteroidales bacterium]
MKTYVNTPRSEWAALVARSLPDDTAIEERVRGILARVKEGGDKALRDITTEIDGCAPDSFLVSREEIESAVAKVSSKVKAAVAEADERISAFHKLQIPRDAVSEVGGVRCVRKYLPIEKVGLYIPGGSAPLFSTI